jgi:hypothetical protein
MKDTIQSAIKSGHGNAVIYAGAIGLLLSDVIPTPADAVYFYSVNKWKKQLENKEITPKQYWIRDAVAYYTYNPIWWAIVLSSLYYTKGNYSDKIKVGVAVISAGAVLAVINKNINSK